MIVNILHSKLKVNGNELAFLFPLKFNAINKIVNN